MNNIQEIIVRDFLVQPLLLCQLCSFEPAEIIVPFQPYVFDVVLCCTFSALIIPLNRLIVILKAEQRRSRPDEPLRTASYLGTLRLAFTNGRWLIDDFINERRGSFRRLLKPRPTPVEAETEAEQDTE